MGLIHGKKYNMLKVVRKTNERSRGNILWEFRCDCGELAKLIKWNVTSGNTKSCGCFKNESIARIGRNRAVDLTGKSFGRLTVIKKDHIKRYKNTSNIYWLCKCICGKETKVKSSHLKSGGIKSCGCLEKENLNKIAGQVTHGQTKTKLYYVWNSMRMRCRNPNTDNYRIYGGRGITYCKEWENFEPFHRWAMENGYEEHLTIDRIDVNGNYEPSNCRWSTWKQQANNKRNTVKN